LRGAARLAAFAAVPVRVEVLAGAFDLADDWRGAAVFAAFFEAAAFLAGGFR